MSKHRIKFSGRLKQTLVCIGLVLFFMSVGITESFSQAPKRYKPEAELPIEYPDGFHGFGPIDALREDVIVIGDMLIKLSPSVTFHTPTNMNSYPADFNKGDLVGYLKNSEGEITSLWLIP